MNSTRTLVYAAFERFWHWAQALLVLFLAFTGFEVHGSFSFLGFEAAVHAHRLAAAALLALAAFAIFWHLTTGEWRQYVPTLTNLRAYAEYYVSGVFRGAPHPTRRTRASKLNPLQRLVYLQLKLLVLPVMAVTGLVYYFYRYPQRHGVEALGLDGLETVAALHTAGAFFLVAFVLAHVYLITTGETATAHLKAMITGYEEAHEGSPASPPVPAPAPAPGQSPVPAPVLAPVITPPVE